MALDRPVCIPLCITFAVFGYVYGEIWWNFEPLQNVVLDNNVFTKINDCQSDTQCYLHCNLDRFCGFAQFNKQSRVCRLKRKDTCATIKPAPQLNVYKRKQINIAQMIVLDGVSFDHVNGNTNHPGENALDGDMYTKSIVSKGAGSEWKMNFQSTWPISKLSITYLRYYGQLLDVRVSGQLFARDGCRTIPGRYGVSTCNFIPETPCWQDASTVNITSRALNLAIGIFEIEIIS